MQLLFLVWSLRSEPFAGRVVTPSSHLIPGVVAFSHFITCIVENIPKASWCSVFFWCSCV